MTEYPAGTSPQPAQKQAEGTLHQGKEAARQVAGAAMEQTGAVAGEARDQTRRAVEQIRERARAQAQQQSERAAQGIRQWADDLAALQESAKPDSPVTGVVRQVADGGRRAADYLEQNGFAGVLGEVQDFARRRPGMFLAGALAAGFLVGRIAKAAGGSEQSTPGSAPQAAPQTGPQAVPQAGETSRTWADTESAPAGVTPEYLPPVSPAQQVPADPAGTPDPAWPPPAPGPVTPPPSGRPGDLP